MYRKEWNTKTIIKKKWHTTNIRMSWFSWKWCEGDFFIIIIHLQNTSNNMYLEENCILHILCSETVNVSSKG